jgi:hypothetical protein
MAQADAGVTEADIESVDAPYQIWSKFPGLSNSKLFQEFLYRLKSGRDMHCFITAASETGVGKTTLAFAIAILWDIHGWTAEKATLDPREYGNLYDEVQPGSVLMLDEAEQAADNRRGMSRDNLELSHSFATKRYRQVFGVLTAPSRSWLDDRISNDSADYWIQAQETDQGEPKGEATVYRLRENEHYENDYTTKTEVITWPILDWHSEFRKLERKKAEKMEGVNESQYVHRDDVEEMKQNFWNKATKMTRYHLVCSMAENGITQTKISDILTSAEHVEGLSQSQVSRYVNADEFEEVYSS